jgi:metallopeptidase MepB
MNKEAGQRFRDMILRPGGSQPAMEILTDFLGRKPRPDAFYKWMGFKINDLDGPQN